MASGGVVETSDRWWRVDGATCEYSMLVRMNVGDDDKMTTFILVLSTCTIFKSHPPRKAKPKLCSVCLHKTIGPFPYRRHDRTRNLRTAKGYRKLSLREGKTS